MAAGRLCNSSPRLIPRHYRSAFGRQRAGKSTSHWGAPPPAPDFSGKLHAAGGDVLEWMRINIDQAWMDISYRSGDPGTATHHPISRRCRS